MRRKILVLLGFFLLLSPSAFADNRDFSQLNPTIKITSYKKLFIGDVQGYASGSGTLISDQGLILTNRHVVFDEDFEEPLDAFSVCLTLNLKEEPVCEYTAQLIASDQERDIALLKLNSRDVFGRALPFPFPYLSPQNDPVIHEQDRVRIAGYPASGGETITISQGQVSGFEQLNGYRYFKTDTDFDHGSSGGTALDSESHFVGIPTYIRSYAENVGYFLDIKEVVSWIDAHGNDAITDNQKWDSLLRDQLKKIAVTNLEHHYSHPVYPFFELDLPEDWKVVSIRRDAVFFMKKNSQDILTLSLEFSFYQFPIEKPYFDRLYLDLDKMKESYPDFNRKSVSLAGQRAELVSFTSMSQRNFDIYLAFGYAMAHIHYSVDLNKATVQQREMQTLLDSLQFKNTPLTEPALDPTIAFDDPAFHIQSKGDWRFQKHTGVQPEGLIAEAVEKNNFDGNIYLIYRRLSKSEQNLSIQNRLNEMVKLLQSGATTLVNKNDRVTLDGLPGWLITYEYEGQNYQEMHQRLEIHLSLDDYELIFVYDDLAPSFKKNISVIEAILRSFTNDNAYFGNPSLKGVYRFGTMVYPFDDIQYHRFALAISHLTEREIFKGEGSHFFPESPVSRAQALSIIIDSKRALDRERGAKRKGYSPYSLLRPNATITLAEALKLLLRVYEVPVWNNADGAAPWYKPFLDKGYELGLIPQGLFDPAHRLTKAELAALIDTIYNQAH
ncbi:trypsin-like peptidase domain-containing protein [Candidatus Peregrinibacteria bacterium]|nr:trypsin-like peptidase domain-containing protein [Candidatus Peregrinibacteria bacterium]